MKTVLNVKVDSHIKNQAQILAKSLGLPLSIVVNNYLRNFIRNREITFSEITLSKKFLTHIKKLDKDIKQGKNLSLAFHSSKEMDNHLDSP
jgi:addiction module RelB/DinJ family antitoxin